ncbi:RidA family protein [Ramlibacter algicola]|uniref:RidA family protein n=1 Tax=Ramlibacter algicola TaxID=2795217 RepID=A0A934UQK8_9BURK|nr:RidA family protein [Ramlibacter algicola]MBK0392754.1 RidA family protein [Ramlibacter algicola]
MPRRLISSGSAFEARIGYSRAVVDGEWVFVSGTTGYDYQAGRLPRSVEAQCEQAMRNVQHALEQAGASWADVVRVVYVLPDRADFEKCWPTLQKHLGEVRPAAMMLQAGLLEPAMKFEVEVTARKR